MSDPIGHDPDPDRAALDELRSAFGIDDDETDADPASEMDATGPVDAVEPEAVLEPKSVVAPEPRPTIVIGDPADFDEPVAPARSQGDDRARSQGDDPARSQGDDRARSQGDDPARSQGDDPARSQGDEPATDRVRVANVAVDPGLSVIAIGGDDELPDAVYVEGSLDAKHGTTVVIIEDDSAADALTPESDRDLRRGIEPRFRERRVAVKRSLARKRLKWVALVAAAALIALGALAVLGSSLFAIREDQLTVTGNVYTDPARLAVVVDDLVGTPVLVADTSEAERRLEEIPWVLDARVRTSFPHGATIEIREREAMATYQGPDGRYRVLDREGRVLDVLTGYPFAYVLLTGPDPVDLEPAAFAPRGYVAAAELSKMLTGSVRGNVESIEVTADGSRLVMRLADGSEVRFGDADELLAKLIRLETLILQNPEREPGIIDVSTSQTTL